MNDVLRITTPSRLHFGLLRFAQDAGPSYGGMGLMLDRPRFVIDMSRNAIWGAKGPLSERAIEFAKRVTQAWNLPEETALKISVQEAPPAHAGLGSGTQLALAISTGIRHLLNLPKLEVTELCQVAGRGKRSAVGAYGFALGGLIWETGYLPDQTFSPLQQRLDIPPQWKVLLIQPANSAGLSGNEELAAFQSLPPVPAEASTRLEAIAWEEILPAVENSDYARFAASVYEYGFLAGTTFAKVQGGPYASGQISRCVEKLRSLGIEGVGQSSWGPTIFAIAENEYSALRLKDELSELPEFVTATITISSINNRGAFIEKRPHNQTQLVPV